MQTPTKYQTELRTWLVDYLHKRGMNVTDCYSVSICRTCNHRGMWGGEMTGVRATTCAGCKNQTAHDFHPYNLGENAQVEARDL